MAQKPSIPKGTRDFNAEEVAKRSYIMETIKEQFQVYGFQPIETPSFENSDTLMGKYGDEGDRLIFKILESGEYLKKVDSDLIERSISLYLVNISLFKDLVKYLIGKIKRDRDNFKTKEELLKLIEDRNSLNRTKNSISELTFYHIKDNYIRNEYNIFLNLYKEKFLVNAVNFIFLYGLDFNNKVNDKKLINNKLEWHSREEIKVFSNKIINIFEKKLDKEISELKKIYYNFLSNEISGKALRYDLTVPFARYVVQHQNEIEFPFKRYQIQPVWRADRPQKGRFREFFQCDADVVGSKSLLQEVEFVQLYDTVFSALKLEGVTIKINNRKILSGIAEVIGAQDKLIDFTVALDKLDKIGEEKVKEEMRGKGISEDGISKLQPLFTLKGDFGNQIESLKSILGASEIGLKGIKELEFINTTISNLKLKTATLELDVTLARGLNYYTGAIFEVSAPEGVKMGSIGGGGRYDDLTGIFGLKDMSGVGISFGLDRIYLVLEELDLFPDTIAASTKVLFINFGEQEALFSLGAVTKLRQANVKAELFPDAAISGKQKKKQMNYANRRDIPFVVVVGEEELKSNMFTLKNMTSGEQHKVEFEALLELLK